MFLCVHYFFLAFKEELKKQKAVLMFIDFINQGRMQDKRV